MNRLILVIDDSPVIRKLVEVTLRREGYEVVGFPDGVAALGWLARSDAQIPELIFLDITMPKLDGFEVARMIKSKPRYAAVPVVMLTRRNDLVDRLKARLAEASAYVTKPFTTATIIATVQRYVGSSQGWDRQSE